MQENIVLKDKCILDICNFMVSIATHYATLKNEDVPEQQLIIEY